MCLFHPEHSVGLLPYIIGALGYLGMVLLLVRKHLDKVVQYVRSCRTVRGRGGCSLSGWQQYQRGLNVVPQPARRMLPLVLVAAVVVLALAGCDSPVSYDYGRCVVVLRPLSEDEDVRCWRTEWAVRGSSVVFLEVANHIVELPIGGWLAACGDAPWQEMADSIGVHHVSKCDGAR